VTNAVHDRMGLLQDMLEEQFELHTGQLTQLSSRSREAGAAAVQDDVAAALTSSSRQALADIADALRRIAEDTYGTCERCGERIPMERLEILPHTRFCVRCQARVG
jgi:RNA polymerase-binding transcription factor DksA